MIASLLVATAAGLAAVLAPPSAAHAPSGAASVQKPADEPQQERGGPPRPRLERMAPRFRDRGAGPLLAVDGEPVAPGRVPAGTTQGARELWLSAQRSTVVGEAPAPHVDSFAVTFDFTGRHDNGRNDLTVDVQFQERPGGGWMRTLLQRSGRVQLRGPRGDWLLEKGNATSLAGRENEVSRRDMDQWIAIANHFLTLVNTEDVRLVSLREVGSPAPRLPEEVRSWTAELAWLEVTSPDFHLYPVPEEQGPPVLRATLGIRPADGRVLATLIEDTNPANAGYSRLVVHERWEELDGRRMPKTLLIYLIDPDTRAFYPRPVYEVTLYRGGRLNPDLGEAPFRPEADTAGEDAPPGK